MTGREVPLVKATVWAVAVVAAVSGLAGCSTFSSTPASSAAHTSAHRKPRHWITIHPGQTRTYAADSVALPLTIACPKPAGSTVGSGLKQVIRTPLPRGKTASFGDSNAGESITVAVSSDGALRVSC